MNKQQKDDTTNVVCVNDIEVSERKCPSAEEYVKTMTKEAFQTEVPYKGLYLIKDEFRREKVEYLLKEKALELGGKELVSYFNKAKKAYFKQQERKRATVMSDGMTAFSNLPENVRNLSCGMSWNATDRCIMNTASGTPTLVGIQPLLITKILKSLDTGEEQLEIAFKCDNMWKFLVCDKDTLASTQSIVSLNKKGLSVTTINSRIMIAYLQDMEMYSREQSLIPVVFTTSKMGWNKDKTEFYPFTNSNVEYVNKGSLARLQETLAEQGNRDEWVEMYKKVRGIPMIDFATAVNLSAPIVGFLELEGFIGNIYGQSRGGKSVTNKIAASIWAGIRPKDQFVHGSDNTVNSLEGYLRVHGSLPLILEDANNMPPKQQKQISGLIMKIANGTGRGRMNKDTSLRESENWATTGLLTSEFKITRQCTNTGSVNRTLVLRGTDAKDCPFNKNGLNAGELLRFFENNHGFAGKEFIQKLIELGQNEISRRLEKIEKEVLKEAEKLGKSVGQILPVSMMLLADRLAEEFIFQDGKRISIKTALSYMAEESEADQNQRFYEYVIDLILENSGKFEGLSKIEKVTLSNYWGRYREKQGEIAILPRVLEKWAEEEGVDIGLFLEFLEGKGLTKRGADGYFKRNVTSEILERKNNRMYIIAMPSEAEPEGISPDASSKEDNKVIKLGEQPDTVCVDDEEIPFEISFEEMCPA